MICNSQNTSLYMIRQSKDIYNRLSQIIYILFSYHFVSIALLCQKPNLISMFITNDFYDFSFGLEAQFFFDLQLQFWISLTWGVLKHFIWQIQLIPVYNHRPTKIDLKVRLQANDYSDLQYQLFNFQSRRRLHKERSISSKQ